jgi:hypothetical protein
MEFIVTVALIVLVMKFIEATELRIKEKELESKFNSSKLPPPLAMDSAPNRVQSDIRKARHAGRRGDSSYSPSMPLQSALSEKGDVSPNGVLPGEIVEQMPAFGKAQVYSYPESINVSVNDEVEYEFDISHGYAPMAGIEDDYGFSQLNDLSQDA